MKLPKSSENMLRAFSMGGSWAGRARAAEAEEEDAEEEEEEWKLLSALKLEEVRWLIHSGQPGPARGRVDAGAGEGAGECAGPGRRRFIRPGRPGRGASPLSTG